MKRYIEFTKTNSFLRILANPKIRKTRKVIIKTHDAITNHALIFISSSLGYF